MDILTNAAALAVLAVVVVQQILKSNFIPVTLANNYPVPVNIFLSVVATVIVAIQGGVHLTDWTSWVLLIATIFVGSAIVYNATLANWASLRATEGPKVMPVIPATPVAVQNQVPPTV